MTNLLRISMTAAVALSLCLLAVAVVQSQVTTTPAPAGFDNQTNGFLNQSQFDQFRAQFEERDVPPALGSVEIHPFSDFLLHDVGTGDGIVQNGPPDTQNKLRTPPLWGLRARTRFMHDLQNLTLPGAIQRHRGEATSAVDYVTSLSGAQQQQLLAFLNSL
jgi:hypothetical protein